MDRDLAWTLFASGSAIALGAAARWALKESWRSTTGDDPPENPAAANVTWGKALAWAAVSTAVVAVSRVAARRGAAAGWERFSGSPAPLD